MRARITNLISMLMLASCVTPLDDDADDDAVIPAQVQRVFNESCVGCHDGRNEFSLLADASPAIVRTRSVQRSELLLVELGRVDRSYLAIKVLPDAEGRDKDIMPPPPAVLTAQDQLLIAGWIAGATLPDATDGDATGETGLEVQGCAIEDFDAQARSPIEAGAEPGLIPPDIADVLERNCGCHYVEGEPGRVLLRIDTWDDFQVERRGEIVHVIAKARLHAVAPMPPLDCKLEDGSNITMEDFERLDAWYDAGAPDGTDWMPE